MKECWQRERRSQLVRNCLFNHYDMGIREQFIFMVLTKMEVLLTSESSKLLKTHLEMEDVFENEI